ncbi:MAG TPA: hypothetical protein VNT27_04520 [Propionibacteriaceae bacterium]|nr:hypothetical protein [Propionibacteriaceae bacterium]
MGELANRLDDSPHNAADNCEGVSVTHIIGERSQWSAEACLDGGAGVLHLRARVRR